MSLCFISCNDSILNNIWRYIITQSLMLYEILISLNDKESHVRNKIVEDINK